MSFGLAICATPTGPASQAALRAHGRAHRSLDRTASSAGHQLRCLMRGDGISPAAPWEPGLPSQGGLGSWRCTGRVNPQCPSPGGCPVLLCPCCAAGLGGGTQRRYELDSRALTANSVTVCIRRLRVQRLMRPSTSPQSIQSRKRERNLKPRGDGQKLGQNSAEGTTDTLRCMVVIYCVTLGKTCYSL